MARIVVTSLADADTAEILYHLGREAGAPVADRYEADFEALYKLLANFPNSGAPRPILGKDMRIGVVFPYLVLYEFAEIDDVVTIMRVVHGRRKITRRLLRSTP